MAWLHCEALVYGVNTGSGNNSDPGERTVRAPHFIIQQYSNGAT